MLTISKLNDDFFIAKIGYSREYFNRLMNITGSEYVNEDKNRHFVIPMSSYIEFSMEFFGEIVYKTPKTEFQGSVIDDYKEKYKLKKKYNLPELKITPYSYQQYAFHFMLNKLEEKGFVLNCDGVGLGKTFESIAVAMYLIKNKIVSKVLILCKKSLKQQWKKEFKKFTDYDLDKVLIVDGLPKKKEVIYKEFISLKEGILICNYDVVVSEMDKKLLQQTKTDLLIIDEIHLLKNPKTLKASAISKVADNAKYKVFLTGTPMASRPDDLFGIMKLANKKYFGTRKAFDESFLKYEFNELSRRDEIVGYKNLDLLEEMTHNIMISRSDKEVELDLPEILPPNRLILEMDTVQCRIHEVLDKESKQLVATINSYQEKKDSMIKSRATQALSELNEKLTSAKDMLQGMATFNQMNANDPRIFLLSDSQKIKDNYAPLVNKTYKRSPKNEAMLDIVEDIVEAGQKVIIFAIHERSVNLICSDIEKQLGYQTVKYTGSVNSKDREENVRLFMETDYVNVICLTSAGYEGINLQKANHIIHYDQPPMIAHKIQREGRARRVGSEYDKIHVYDLLTEGSIDIRKIDRLDEQASISKSVTGNSDSRSKAIIAAMGDI